MKLFIGRHGQASFNAESDRVRPLTPEGIVATAKLCDENLTDLQQATVIWSSDLKRALETAAIYAEKLNIDIKVQRFLSPDGEPKTVLKKLQAHGTKDSILIVSHQPLVGELVSVLCEGNVYAAHPYATSEIVEVNYELAESGLAQFSQNFLPK